MDVMEKDLERLEESPKAKINLDSLRAILKKYQKGKRKGAIVYIDTAFKNSFPSWTNHLFISIASRNK